MAIMAFDKEYRPAGKFASVEDAVEACPEHGIVVSSDGELEGLTITQLTAIYNSLVKGNIKKFENKAIATKRTGEAMDAYENPEPINPAPRKRSKKMTTENKEPTARDILRDFLTVGKEFTMDEVAELLETSKANATVTVNLLKKRPGVKYNALVTEKTEDGKYKVVEAPTAKPVEEGE